MTAIESLRITERIIHLRKEQDSIYKEIQEILDEFAMIKIKIDQDVIHG